MATSSFDNKFVIEDPEELDKFLSALNNTDVVSVPSTIKSEECFVAWLQTETSPVVRKL